MTLPTLLSEVKNLVLSKQYSDAIKVYEKLIATEKNPAFVFNHAICHYHAGRLKKALKLLEKCFEYPQHVDASWNTFCTAFSYLNPLTKWEKLKLYQPQLPLTNWVKGAELVKYAIANLALGQQKEFKQNLQSLQALKEELQTIKVQGISQQQLNSLRINQVHVLKFILILERLQKQAVWEVPNTHPAIYAVGDSHTLSMANRNFTLNGVTHTCKTQLVMGCKAFHLGQKEANPAKVGFINSINRLPANATALFVCGEIDCRRDEGMLTYAIKYNKPLEEVIETTANRYIKFCQAHQGKKRIIIAGVAAPTLLDVKKIHPKLQPVFINMINIFNQHLKHYAKIAGFDFIDAYTLTKNPQGIAIDGFHYDQCHMHGSSWQQAFKENCCHFNS